MFDIWDLDLGDLDGLEANDPQPALSKHRCPNCNVRLHVESVDKAVCPKCEYWRIDDYLPGDERY